MSSLYWTRGEAGQGKWCLEVKRFYVSERAVLRGKGRAAMKKQTISSNKWKKIGLNLAVQHSPMFRKDIVRDEGGDGCSSTTHVYLYPRPVPDNPAVWKGVLNSGKTGHFSPANTVTYLGTNIPSNKSNFQRGGECCNKGYNRPQTIINITLKVIL